MAKCDELEKVFHIQPKRIYAAYFARFVFLFCYILSTLGGMKNSLRPQWYFLYVNLHVLTRRIASVLPNAELNERNYVSTKNITFECMNIACNTIFSVWEKLFVQIQIVLMLLGLRYEFLFLINGKEIDINLCILNILE